MNPGLRPYQQPHPPVWIPGVLSSNTVEWCAGNRYPLRDARDPARADQAIVRLLRRVAREHGYEAGTQHRGYLFKVHVDETEELAYEVGAQVPRRARRNIFLEGSRGKANPMLQNLPGMTSRTDLLPTARRDRRAALAGQAGRDQGLRRRRRRAGARIAGQDAERPRRCGPPASTSTRPNSTPA